MKSVNRRTWLRSTGLLSVAGGAVACGWLPGPSRAQTQAQAQHHAGSAAFAWPELRLLDGSLLPASAWQDTGAVLVFWATYCPFCKRHNQHVEKLHRALAGQPVRVLGLSSDRDPALVQRHLQQHGLSFPVSMQSELMRARLGLGRTIPTTMTLDRRGRPGLAIPGEMFEEDVMGLARAAGAA